VERSSYPVLTLLGQVTVHKWLTDKLARMAIYNTLAICQCTAQREVQSKRIHPEIILCRPSELSFAQRSIVSLKTEVPTMERITPDGPNTDISPEACFTLSNA